MSKIWERILATFMYSESHSQRMRNDKLTLYRTPLIWILFFNNFIFVFDSSLLPSLTLLSEEEDELRTPLEEVEESRIVTDALRAVPSGLKIFWRISEN